MNPQRWGPSGWYVLHHMAYKIHNIDEAKEFYHSIGEILPCCTCRDNYRMHIRNVPFPNTRGSVAISKWVYDIHNRVNTSLNKDTNVTFQEVGVKYKQTDRKKEAFFVKCVLKTHPGMYEVSDEYVSALQTFLKILTQSEFTTQQIRSRSYMQKWFMIEYPHLQ
jgi:Erv1 / Alr family